jgi:hypothetical protein
MKVLLDTNAYSALRRGHPFVVEQVRQSESVLLSAVVAGELIFGFRNGSRYHENHSEFMEFLGDAQVHLLPITLDTADHCSHIMKRLLPLLPALLATGCFTDAATRIAYDLEKGAGRLGRAEGARLTVDHRTPSKAGECEGETTVQMDKVGAIIVWCKGKDGVETVSSHSTSYHRRFVETPQTYILEKKAGEALRIELERRGGRVVIADVR